MRKLLIAGGLILACSTISMADSDKKIPVHFAKGKTAQSVHGSVQGHASIDYVVHAKAGQLLSVTQKSSNPQTYFNVNVPGTDLALFNGSVGENKLKDRQLPNDGDYVVRVYLMKAAAGRNEKASFNLNISVTGQSLAALPASKDAKVAKTPYHATAPVPFRYYLEPKVTQCEGGVIRRGHDGTATVVLKSKAFSRSILFVKGKPVASDSAETMKATKKGDLHTIEFGDKNEVYEIRDVFLKGD